MNHLGVHTQGFANHVNHSLGGKGPEVSKQMGLVQDGLTLNECAQRPFSTLFTLTS